MTLKSYLYLTVAAVAVAIIGWASLFYVQNSARTVQLTIDYGFAAFALGPPQPVPVLIFGSFGVGLLLGLTLAGMRTFGQSSRIRRLEQQLALSSAGDNSGEWR